ncbi:MAG: lysophospholipid acyltransferase family protein [Candidatus Binatia bacterium]
MRVLGRVVRFLWGLAADLAIFVSTLWWGGLSIVLALVTRQPWPPDVFAPIWCRGILKVCGIHVDVEGLEHIDRRRSYVLISNHLSNFDIWTTIATVPLKVRFVAKKELLRIPIFGQALSLSDHIIIDRSHPDEAIARINARVAQQIDEGFCILFYAEGTRSPDGKVHRFKKGGVTLALRTGLPIIPVSVSGTRKFLPKRHVVIRPGGRVKIVLAPPIDTIHYPFERRDELNELVRNIIISNYVEDY